MNRVIRLGISLGLAMGAAVCLGQASTPQQSQRQTALALEQQGKNVEAEAAWRVFLKAHPSNPEPYAHLGLLEARQEHYNEAVTLYRKALALNPAMPGLRMNLGLALFKGGELKQAILEFKPLLKNQLPDSDQAQRLTILIGMAHYGLGEYAEAVPYLKQSADHDAQNLPLRLTLAHSCLWAKQYQCVLDTYHEILTLNAESAEADMLAGETLDEMKNPTGAIQQFRAAVKANPKEPDVHYGLGYLLWVQKQYAEAASEFQAELDNNPNHASAMLYLADTYIQIRQIENAGPLLEKVVKLNPALALGHLDLGIVLDQAGRKQDALREMKEAARLDPDDVNVHWRLGRLYRSMDKKDEAKVEFDKASSLNKATDTALVDKISNAHPGPAQAQHPAAVPTEK
jgi:tetratricopeptide (TPR) repeat protein